MELFGTMHSHLIWVCISNYRTFVSKNFRPQGTKVPPHGTFVPNCETVGSLSKLGPTKPGPSKPGQVGINS